MALGLFLSVLQDVLGVRPLWTRLGSRRAFELLVVKNEEARHPPLPLIALPLL
jgi:hypothetical protein